MRYLRGRSRARICPLFENPHRTRQRISLAAQSPIQQGLPDLGVLPRRLRVHNFSTLVRFNVLGATLRASVIATTAPHARPLLCFFRTAIVVDELPLSHFFVPPKCRTLPSDFLALTY